MSDAPHILIVDDHRDIRDAVGRYLQKNGFRSTAVRDAVDMDRALKAGRFDLIVLDVMMPGEDGLSVCRRLSAEGGTPILMLTALGDETDRIVGLEVGADDFSRYSVWFNLGVSPGWQSVKGRIANAFPEMEQTTLGLECTVILPDDDDQRPFVQVHDIGHPLYDEQLNGMQLVRVTELVAHLKGFVLILG